MMSSLETTPTLTTEDSNIIPYYSNIPPTTPTCKPRLYWGCLGYLLKSKNKFLFLQHSLASTTWIRGDGVGDLTHPGL